MACREPKLPRSVLALGLVMLTASVALAQEPGATMSPSDLEKALREAGFEDIEKLPPALLDVPAPLTERERALAIRLAENELAARDLGAGAYVVDVERIRGKRTPQDRPPVPRLASVMHYRATDDTAFRSLVDLGRREVRTVEVLPHHPAPLAPQELETAADLARRNPDVRRVLGRELDRAEIQALVNRFGSTEDPLYGHRVLDLLFLTPSGYVTGLEVLVDLTDERVLVRDRREQR